MKFLNKQTEELLQECINNSSNFPRFLADKFDGLSSEEEERLRNRIKVLVDNGYFSKLQWADNVPWFGSITEDGYDYFHKKDVYIRSKLRNISSFRLLDKECEEILDNLCKRGDNTLTVNGQLKDAKPLEQLEKLGYIKFGKDRISYTLGGNFVALVTVTQTGKNYFKDKEELIEEILLLADESTDKSEKPVISKSKSEPKKHNENSQINFSVSEVKKEDSTETTFKNENKFIFSGILGYNCGTVSKYNGSEIRKKEKGFIVENGIPTLRGFAKISDLAEASHAQYEYQREENSAHVTDIKNFLKDCKNEAKFLPEVILSVNDSSKAKLIHYDHKSFSSISETAKGAIDNLDYYLLEVEEDALTRVDGNHRLKAGSQEDYYIPFSIILWNLDFNNSENLLNNQSVLTNTESEAFLFYILNNTAKRLEAEENFKGLVKSKNWTEDELLLINKYLPLLKYFNERYSNNNLIDSTILYAPLSQICEILTEINSSDIDKNQLDVLFNDSIRIINQSDKFNYCFDNFKEIFFQLAFYTRFKSDDYKSALHNLDLVDKWLERYKYTSDTFTKASKLFDVAYKYISVSPKYIFMAMEYKSDQTVADYNGALSRAIHTINNMGGNIEVEAYPIMTGKGKSFNITSDIYEKIENCSIFIADTTEANPNVMYELGVAYDKKKPIIMVREKGKHIKVPSDIISEYYYNFDGMTELENLFVTHINEILIKDYGAVFPK